MPTCLETKVTLGFKPIHEATETIVETVTSVAQHLHFRDLEHLSQALDQARRPLEALLYAQLLERVDILADEQLVVAIDLHYYSDDEDSLDVANLEALGIDAEHLTLQFAVTDLEQADWLGANALEDLSTDTLSFVLQYPVDQLLRDGENWKRRNFMF